MCLGSWSAEPWGHRGSRSIDGGLFQGLCCPLPGGWCPWILAKALTLDTVLPAVGRVVIEFTSPMPLERVQRENPGVLLGGRYTPPDCTPAQTVAVIIPFRHREHHLRYWLHYLHPMLRRQRLRYGIYVINQVRALWSLAER